MKAKLTRAAGAAQGCGSGSRGPVAPEAALAAMTEAALAACAPRPVGVAMRIADVQDVQRDPDAPIFELAVIDEEGGAVCVLGRYTQEDIVAEWRRLGLASGLPLLLQNPDGSLTAPYPQIGPLALGEIRLRRRHGLLSGRRPRFLTRRKTGRPSARPLVYREREIVGGR